MILSQIIKILEKLFVNKNLFFLKNEFNDII